MSTYIMSFTDIRSPHVCQSKYSILTQMSIQVSYSNADVSSILLLSKISLQELLNSLNLNLYQIYLPGFMVFDTFIANHNTMKIMTKEDPLNYDNMLNGIYG